MNNKGKTTIRSLNESDITEVKKVEKESFFEVSDMTDSPDYGYGIFVENSLVGFCTIGCADVIDDIEAVATHILVSMEIVYFYQTCLFCQNIGQKAMEVLLFEKQ